MMVKASKENLTAAIAKALTLCFGNSQVALTDENGHDITNTSDFSLLLSTENGEIVVKDVYPGRVYARIRIEADWTF